jgi:hypothetical protein
MQSESPSEFWIRKRNRLEDFFDLFVFQLSGPVNLLACTLGQPEIGGRITSYGDPRIGSDNENYIPIAFYAMNTATLIDQFARMTAALTNCQQFNFGDRPRVTKVFFDYPVLFPPWLA